MSLLQTTIAEHKARQQRLWAGKSKAAPQAPGEGRASPAAAAAPSGPIQYVPVFVPIFIPVAVLVPEECDSQNGPSIRLIAETVAAYYKVSVADLMYGGRRSDLCYFRYVAYHLARIRTKHTLKLIGHVIGRHDHTSVMHGIKKIRKRLESDPEAVREVGLLSRQLDRLVGETGK